MTTPICGGITVPNTNDVLVNGGNMNKTVTIQIDGDIVERVRDVAKKERRSLSGQAVYLIELGLAVHEARFDRNAGQARELAEAIEAAR